MSERKYKHVLVFSNVNVSSSCDYHFQVTWDGGKRDYTLGVGFLTNRKYNPYTWEGAPKYLHAEVERQILSMFKDGYAKFYEYDRDGNKRWENYRYHDPLYVKSWIESLSAPTVTP